MTRAGVVVHTVMILLFLSVTAQSEPIINEVLANEPGSERVLEWVEIYNNSSQPVALGEYQLYVDESQYDLPSADTLGGGEYYIICRRLFSDGSSSSFESRWGDSSAVWGDTPGEDSIMTPHEVSISLINTGGTVELREGGATVSQLTWTESGLDGISWERVAPDESGISQSVAPGGCTPGRANSLVPVDVDLAVEDVEVTHEWENTILSFTVANRGTTAVSGSNLYLIYTGAPDGVKYYNIGDTLGSVAIRPLKPGESAAMVGQFVFEGEYLLFTAILPADHRNDNNSLIFVAVGQDYPPFVLSELMADPNDDLGTEWLEIKSRSNEAIEIEGWLFGDSLHTYPLSSGSRIIEPGEYIVVAQAAIEFISFYTGFSQRVWQPSNWPAFNNDGDVVRLIDPYGIEADRFEYSFTHEGEFTWARGEEPGKEDLWGRSETALGTPGGYNDVIFLDGDSQIDIVLGTAYISPDDDGIDDYTTIDISAPIASDYTVKIYDRQGREVKIFYDKDISPPTTIIWDGLSDAGRRLPIGLYILYVEAGGVASEKLPIVIAR